jgi:carboxyl-terminal processing protease
MWGDHFLESIREKGYREKTTSSGYEYRMPGGMPPEMVREFETEAEGQFGGLGIVIRFLPVKRAVEVEEIVPGTPAAKQGILPGSLILEIREESSGVVTRTEDFDTIFDAVKVLRGRPGTKVTITILQGGDGDKRDVTIRRDIIKVPGVRAMGMIDEERKIGYVYIAYFSKRLTEDLKEAVAELLDQGAKGLVLDLRGNSGGLLDAARDATDLFLDGRDKEVIVSTRGRSGPTTLYTARRGEIAPGIPIVMLVNRFSASGAEIMAAAMRDHERAVLVGEHTFGKASVQTVLNNPFDESAVKLTIARYYTPNGLLIEGEGVKPDVELALSDEETEKLLTHLARKTNFPPPADGEEASPDEAGEDGAEAEPAEPFHDVQLKRAVEELAGVLAGRDPFPTDAPEPEAAPAPAVSAK